MGDLLRRLPMSAEPVSARLFEADTDIPIITNDGEEEIGEFSTTTQRAGLPFDAWVWIGPKYPKFSSDGIRVVVRSGDNDPQTYVIRFKERNEHVTWHKLPGLYVQRPPGECVYGPYRMTPQHPSYDPQKHRKVERHLLYDPKYLWRLEFTRIKFIKKVQETGSQGASTDGRDRFMDILVDREQSGSDVVVAKPSKLQVLGGHNGETTSLDLVNAAGHGSALASTRLTSRPALPSTGSANAQHFADSEMHGTPPGGYVPSGWADSTTGFRHMQDRVLYGRQGAQRDDPGAHYYGHAAYPSHETPAPQQRYNFDISRVGNEGTHRASQPASGRQAVDDFTERAHTHDLATYGGQFRNPYVQNEEFRVPRGQFVTPPVGGEGIRGQFVMPLMGGEEARRSEAFLRQQFGVLPAGRGSAQGRPMHGTQTLQYNHYGTPFYGHEGVHSEQQRGRGQREPRNAHEEGHGSLSTPAARQQGSGAHQHGLPPPEGQRNSSALSAASASRNSSHPEQRSGARPQGPPPRESQRNSRVPPMAPASQNPSQPEQRSGARQEGPRPRKRQRNSRASPVPSASQNPSHPEQAPRMSRSFTPNMRQNQQPDLNQFGMPGITLDEVHRELLSRPPARRPRDSLSTRPTGSHRGRNRDGDLSGFRPRPAFAPGNEVSQTPSTSRPAMSRTNRTMRRDPQGTTLPETIELLSSDDDDDDDQELEERRKRRRCN